MTANQSPPSAARAYALDLIRAVLGRRVPLDEALTAGRAGDRLAPRDRAFARLLATTVLRRLGQLDALIDACLERPLKPKLAGARDLMRLGAAQLLFLGTPAHAAVDSTVRLARGPRAAGYRGLVNAVLRRLARQGAGLLADQSPARLNTPDWLWDSWVAAHGDSATRAIAEAHLGEPPLDLSVADPAARAEWAARLDAAVLPTGTVRLAPGHGDVARLPGYDEGGWWVQDAAAALPARLLGDIAGRRVLDLCAAPGGKTMQLAAAGARVTALDISPRRVARLRENLARLGLAAETVVADAATWRPPALFDAVLLDAPCSATGTIRRHPDIARLKRPADVTALSAVQDRLLAAALAMVAPGGVLVYAACSLQSEEGAARIEALLARGAPAERDPIGAGEVGGLAEAITAEGDLRTLPCHLAGAGGMDGFHACRLRLRGRGHTVT